MTPTAYALLPKPFVPIVGRFTAKQELAFEKCHSEFEAHHHAHFELLFTAETLLAVALFELSKEKTSDDEGFTHDKMVQDLFHTRCQVRVKTTRVFSESLLIVTHKCGNLQYSLNYFGQNIIWCFFGLHLNQEFTKFTSKCIGAVD